MTTTIITTRAAEARRLRACREAAGLTQRELALAAECSLTTVANVENGAVPTRSAVLDRIRAVLDPEDDADRGRHPGPLKEAAGAGDRSPTRAA
jgi:transcriptional regulator with XRE-family HTH domain